LGRFLGILKLFLVGLEFGLELAVLFSAELLFSSVGDCLSVLN